MTPAYAARRRAMMLQHAYVYTADKQSCWLVESRWQDLYATVDRRFKNVKQHPFVEVYEQPIWKGVIPLGVVTIIDRRRISLDQ